MSRIVIPYLNPVKFHKLTPDESSKYLTKHMEEWNYSNATPDWQSKPIFAQPYQTTDNITLQFQSSFAEVDQVIELINCYGQVFLTPTITQGAESETEPGLFVYEVDQALTGIAQGYYYLRISASDADDDILLISEPLQIKERHDYSKLLEYSHFQNKDGIFFETDIVLQLRVSGELTYKQPASRDTSYEDQSLDQTLLDSVPYRIWELYVGGTTGIPSYLIDRINRILGCSSLAVDGKSFTKSDGAKLEEKASDDERYPLRGWTVDLQEAENPYAAEYSTVADTPATPPTQLTTPVLSLAADSDSQITASWLAIANADSYTLLRATVNNFSVATVIYSGTNLSHVSTGLQAAKRYYYWLRAEGSGAYSPSEYDTANEITDAAAPVPVTLDAPVLTLTATDFETITAAWTAVTNATAYEFYTNLSDDLGSATLVYSGPLLTYDMVSLSPNTTYFGWVRALGDDVNYLDSAYASDSATTDPYDPSSTVFDTILSAPGTFVFSDSDQGVYAFFGLGDAKEFQFNAISPRTGVGIRMGIKVGGTGVCVVDFPGDYSGQPFRYIHSDSSEHLGTFPSVNTTIDF